MPFVTKKRNCALNRSASVDINHKAIPYTAVKFGYKLSMNTGFFYPILLYHRSIPFTIVSIYKEQYIFCFLFVQNIQKISEKATRE